MRYKCRLPRRGPCWLAAWSWVGSLPVGMCSTHNNLNLAFHSQLHSNGKKSEHNALFNWFSQMHQFYLGLTRFVSVLYGVDIWLALSDTPWHTVGIVAVGVASPQHGNRVAAVITSRFRYCLFWHYNLRTLECVHRRTVLTVYRGVSRWVHW